MNDRDFFGDVLPWLSRDPGGHLTVDAEFAGGVLELAAKRVDDPDVARAIRALVRDLRAAIAFDCTPAEVVVSRRGSGLVRHRDRDRDNPAGNPTPPPPHSTPVPATRTPDPGSGNHPRRGRSHESEHAMARTDGTQRGKADPSRDAEAARLRALRFSYDQIAEQLGYADHSGAQRAAERGRKVAVREPHEDMVLMDLAELDEMAREAWKVLRAEHFVVDKGQVVLHPHDDTPLHDDAPVLAAIGRLLDVQTRRAKLVGLDAPTRSRVEVITRDDVEAEIERLTRELAANDR